MIVHTSLTLLMVQSCGLFSTRLDHSPFRDRVGKLLAIGRDLIAQACSQQLLTQPGERLHVGVVIEIVVPTQLVPQRRRFAKARRVHDLQVLLILPRCPCGHLIQPLARKRL